MYTFWHQTYTSISWFGDLNTTRVLKNNNSNNNNNNNNNNNSHSNDNDDNNNNKKTRILFWLWK